MAVGHCCRSNQALERDWQYMIDEKFRLQQERANLARSLEAVLNDKFGHQNSNSFDADTPVDKMLVLLQFVIAVSCSSVRAATATDYRACS